MRLGQAHPRIALGRVSTRETPFHPSRTSNPNAFSHTQRHTKKKTSLSSVSAWLSLSLFCSSLSTISSFLMSFARQPPHPNRKFSFILPSSFSRVNFSFRHPLSSVFFFLLLILSSIDPRSKSAKLASVSPHIHRTRSYTHQRQVSQRNERNGDGLSPSILFNMVNAWHLSSPKNLILHYPEGDRLIVSFLFLFVFLHLHLPLCISSGL